LRQASAREAGAIDRIEFDQRLERRAGEILALLSQSRWKPSPRVPRGAELRKNLGRLYTAIADARRLVRTELLDEGARSALVELLDVEPRRLSSDSLGELLAAVDELLIAKGDELYVCGLLESEYARDAVDRGSGVATWSSLYGDERLAASREFAQGDAVTEKALDEAKRKLAALSRTRHSLYALERARTMTKAARLLWLAPVLTALIVATVVTIDLVADDTSWRAPLLAALAGALGATLSGTYKLRDQMPRVGVLRGFWYAFAVQPPLGAVAGLFVWLVLRSGLVAVVDAGPEWAIEAAVAFAAGFSEPFLLKTVERIAGIGEARPS
jgi:hypothetical protein